MPRQKRITENHDADGRRKPEITVDEALSRVEALCAASEHSSYEIIRKLRGWHIADNDIDNIIASLEESQYVDDRRFAHAVVRDKFKFGNWGKAKIILWLRSRKVADKYISEAIDEEIDEEEYINALRRLLRNRRRTGRLGLNYADRSNLYRYALGRGFETSLIMKLISDQSTWAEDDE